MPDAYYEVPIPKTRGISIERGGRLGVTVGFPQIEETAIDHTVGTFVGLALFGLGTAYSPGLVSVATMLAGGFLAGWAANNALISWRCDRREAEEAADD